MIEFLKSRLEQANKKNQKRILFEAKRINGEFFFDNKKVIDFSSNDYLDLSSHPYLIQKSNEYSIKYGVGATASRLVCGTHPVTNRLEKKLASFKGTQESLIFNSGFQANVSILSSICSKKSLLIMDKFCHNSLIQGALLSKGKILRYRHNDLDHLEKILQNASSKMFDRIFIITESIFGMDGDILDIDKLCFLAKKYKAYVYLDEAHAIGVLGSNGEGLSVTRDIFISLGTFGKAFGSFGAFISCSRILKDFLINYCPGIIFSTALPPPIIGAIEAALQMIPNMHQERKCMFSLAAKFRKSISKLGFVTTESSSHIVPIICKNEQETLKLYEYLLNNGIYAVAIRPPTVPQNMSRVRFALSSRHEEKDIDRVITLLTKYSDKSQICQK